MLEAADAVLVQHVGVQVRAGEHRAGDGIEHDVADGDSVVGLAGGLELLAVLEDLRGVEGEVVGQLGHGAQGGVHGLADDPADAAKLHILVLGLLRSGRADRGSGLGGRGGLDRRSGGSGDTLRQELAHIPLNDPSLGAGGGGQGGVHTGVLGHLPGPGGDGGLAAGGSRRGRGAGRRSGGSCLGGRRGLGGSLTLGA